MTTPWTVEYHDGNANTYQITRLAESEPARFTYTPITPLQSSSGVYSGGDPTSGPLSPEQTQTLWTHLRSLRADTTGHAERRFKGTGSIAWQTPDDSAQFLITWQAARALNMFLEQIKGRTGEVR